VIIERAHTPPSTRPAGASRAKYHAIFLAAFALLALVLHAPYFSLPYFWDELGQFVPAGLDILRHGWWVPRSATPNVHPPGVMAYLAAVWKIAGYSIAATRVAMLLAAALALYAAFLLAIEMGRRAPGAPALIVVALLLATPLFYMQAMMAQLDMPAMALTSFALLLFMQRRYAWCAGLCTALVLVKETGAIAPALFGAWLLAREKRWREALYFAAPFIALALWLVALKRQTGFWLGDPGFERYNVGYSLHPVRAAATLARRLYYLFIAEFRWIGSLAIVYALRRTPIFRRPRWAVAGAFFCAHVLVVSLFGGAALERYLLPVFPILYIAMAAALEALPAPLRLPARAALIIGLLSGLFWNPPYPFPYENNLAMIDFIRLQQAAASYLEHHAPRARVATAWPFSIALRRPDNGYVTRRFSVVETTDFHPASVSLAVRTSRPDVLITYARTWEPAWSVLNLRPIAAFLGRFYDYQPQISAAEIERDFGMRSVFRLELRGQWIEIFQK
jgi:4-amino-4-deoxy-L-arabinose transferase-like glycosyltransferase